jgi:ABC-type transport system involved in cytochrome c biogenesis permease component
VISLLPIANRELRLASRRPGTYWTRFCTASLLGGVLLAMATTTSEPPWRVSGIIFWVLKAMAFAYCLFAGVGATADALSKERREGTLGLLFLTDLRGYDVVIGKLVITSLAAFFGLLAAIPLLAVPVMMGGLTWGEFWRTTLVLINTLIFSLSIGLAISAFGVSERGVMLRTLLALAVVTFALPGCWHALGKPVGQRWLEILLLFPSPAYALRTAPSGLIVPVRSDFWPCMVTVAGISLFCLFLACVKLPRSVRETESAPSAENVRLRAGRVVFGSGALRARLRKQLDRGRPYLWRVSRDQTMAGWPLLVFVVLVVFLPFYLDDGPIVLSWVGVHWFIKLLVTLEACRPFSEDKHSGTLELILCTPLSTNEMVGAHRRRLLSLFLLPLLPLCILNYVIASDTSDQVLAATFVLGIFTLLADCWALGWVGMRSALQRGTYTRAVFSTLWRVMVPAWIAFLVLFLWLMAGRGDQATVCRALTFWTFGAVTFDIWLVAHTWLQLTTRFRHLASGV